MPNEGNFSCCFVTWKTQELFLGSEVGPNSTGLIDLSMTNCVIHL